MNNRENNQGSPLILEFLSGVFDLLLGEYFLLLIPLVIILIVLYMFIKSIEYAVNKLSRRI